MEANCIFCKICQGAIPADILYQDDDLVAFWDIAPQAPKHFLVIPRKHIGGPAEITAADQALIGRLVGKAGELARENGIDSFRLVMNEGAEAGQTVFHIHIHVLGGRALGWPPG